MRLVRDKKISVKELQQMSEKMTEGFVKAVVDIDQELMVVDAAMHADAESFLLQNNSAQENLWGIRLHPKIYEQPSWIEFNSMINIRSSQGNRSRSVEDQLTQKKIKAIVKKLVEK